MHCVGTLIIYLLTEFEMFGLGVKRSPSIKLPVGWVEERNFIFMQKFVLMKNPKRWDLILSLRTLLTFKKKFQIMFLINLPSKLFPPVSSFLFKACTNETSGGGVELYPCEGFGIVYNDSQESGRKKREGKSTLDWVGIFHFFPLLFTISKCTRQISVVEVHWHEYSRFMSFIVSIRKRKMRTRKK